MKNELLFTWGRCWVPGKQSAKIVNKLHESIELLGTIDKRGVWTHWETLSHRLYCSSDIGNRTRGERGLPLWWRPREMHSCHFRKGTKPCPRCFYPFSTTKQSLKLLRKKKRAAFRAQGKIQCSWGKGIGKNNNNNNTPATLYLCRTEKGLGPDD